jgi:hypothetical protein
VGRQEYLLLFYFSALYGVVAYVGTEYMSELLDLRGLNNYLTAKLPIYINYRNLFPSDIVGFGNGFRRLDLGSIPNMRFVKPTSIKIGLAISFAEEKPNDMLYQDGFYHTF